MKKKILLVIGLAFFLGSCAATTPDGTEETQNCVIKTEETAVKFVTYNDKEVGFCCDGCMGKFEKMTVEEKDAAIAGTD